MEEKKSKNKIKFISLLIIMVVCLGFCSTYFNNKNLKADVYVDLEGIQYISANQGIDDQFIFNLSINNDTDIYFNNTYLFTSYDLPDNEYFMVNIFYTMNDITDYLFYISYEVDYEYYNNTLRITDYYVDDYYVEDWGYYLEFINYDYDYFVEINQPSLDYLVLNYVEFYINGSTVFSDDNFENNYMDDHIYIDSSNVNEIFYIDFENSKYGSNDDGSYDDGFDDGFDDGIQEVIDNPHDYDLFNQNDLENEYQDGYSDGTSHVLNNLTQYNLHTNSQYFEYGRNRYNEGYSLGSEHGYQEGYEEGYQDGVDDEQFMNGSSPFFVNIFNQLGSILSLPILGEITIGTIIFLPILLGLFMIVIKILRG